jgi:hypothetical protein
MTGYKLKTEDGELLYRLPPGKYVVGAQFVVPEDERTKRCDLTVFEVSTPSVTIQVSESSASVLDVK